MKKLITLFGIALLAITNVALAGNANQGRQSETSFPTVANDMTVSAPETLIGYNIQKSIEETIFEDVQITESEILDIAPIGSKMTMDEIIAEDLKITESQLTNDIFPLDFKRINSKIDFTIIRNNRQAVLFDNK